MTTPHTDAAPLGVERTAPDLAAIEARAAAARDASEALARVLDDEALDATGAQDAAFARRDQAMAESAADIPALLAHVRRLTAALADSDARVASAVAAERGRCRDACERVALYARLGTPREIALACALAVDPPAIAAPTGGV